MEIRNVIELSAFSKSLSKKITYLNHEERILIDIEQIAAITPTSEREDLPKKVGLASCNNDEAKEELYTCVLLKCGFSVRVIESVEEVYNKIHSRYVKNVTNQILRSRDISGKLIKCVHRIAHSNYSNKEIINGTISWSSTSEGSDYWFGLYVNTKK